MPSKARALFELTRLHWFPVGCDFMFWPFGKAEDDAAYLLYLIITCGIMSRLGLLVGGLSFVVASERSR
jgi:hypothetical protein